MKKLLICWLFFSASVLSAALPASGSRFFYTGSGGSLFSGAGSGAVFSETVYSSLLNPAAMAGIELSRWAAGTLLGSSALFNSLSAALPFSRGVISGSLLWIKPGESEPAPDTGHTFMLQGSFSKQLTPGFAFGFGARLLNAWPSPDRNPHFGIGLNLGILLRRTPRTQAAALPATGFGIHDLRFAFTASGLGLNLHSSGAAEWPETLLRSSVSFQFYRATGLAFTATDDLVFSLSDPSLHNAFSLRFKFFNFFEVTGGLLLGADGIGPWSWGAAIVPHKVSDDNTFRLEYGCMPRRFDTVDEYTHTLSLELILGHRDKTPPQSTLSLNRTAFSPNNDGSKDTVLCKLEISDNRQLKNWELNILNASNRIVRRLQSRENPHHKLRPGNFFTRLFATRDSVSVPEQWEWNGQDDRGRTCPDGKYTLIINAGDSRGNRGSSRPVQLTIRTAPPRAAVQVTPTLFSPNGDGNKDSVKITQRTAGTNTAWQGWIFDSTGLPVRRFDWQQSPPQNFLWDGKNEKGRVVPDGNYRFVLQGEDDAGNRTGVRSSSFTVSTVKKPIDLKTRQNAFSPNNDRLLDTVTLIPEISTAKWFSSWTVTVTDPAGRTVFTRSGSNSTPNPLIWDGRQAGKPLPDGLYSCRLTADYMDGDRPASWPRQVRIDNTPPELDLKISPELFSPDGDGEDDQLSIALSMKDVSEISNWQLTVYQDTNIFKIFKGTRPAGQTVKLLWDGKGDDGTLVASATRYSARLQATDTLGNSSSSKPVPINVDILIIRTSRGLKIRVSSIEFAFDKWELLRPDSPILNRVAEILKKYSNYKVIIEGHTDGIGRPDYNLMLSTRRARAVMRYLIRRGIDEDRLLAKGLGASVPLAGNRTPAGRAVNRRVEFILVKD